MSSKELRGSSCQSTVYWSCEPLQGSLPAALSILQDVYVVRDVPAVFCRPMLHSCVLPTLTEIADPEH